MMPEPKGPSQFMAFVNYLRLERLTWRYFHYISFVFQDVKCFKNRQKLYGMVSLDIRYSK